MSLATQCILKKNKCIEQVKGNIKMVTYSFNNKKADLEFYDEETNNIKRLYYSKGFVLHLKFRFFVNLAHIQQ